MSDKKRLISVCVPVYNEEKNVEPLYHTLLPIMSELSDRYNFELLFTDNHSSDGTFDVLERLSSHDPRIRVLRFSRNFGFQRSILTAYLNALGDAAIQLDCDLQDPPSMIVEFVRQWEQGYHVVYGVRCSRKEAGWINFIRKVFYRLIDSLSEDKLPLDAGDFRLIDRRVLEELRHFEDSQPYLRGTIAAIGFNQLGIPYDRAERQRGQSKFSPGELIGLALDGILNHSVVPLRIATYLGLTVSALTLLGAIGYFFGRIFLGQRWPAGFASLVMVSLSLNALFLGIIGEYLGRIYRQVKRRPLTICEREINAPAVNSLEGASSRYNCDATVKSVNG
jgi:glycosyltransferase involved in cell wall biosynthesis